MNHFKVSLIEEEEEKPKLLTKMFFIHLQSHLDTHVQESTCTLN